MFRAALELIITIILVIAARAILGSFLKGLSRGVQFPQQQQNPQQQQPRTEPQKPTGELRRDPVCGTYVAESTQFQRQIGGQTFFYCSEDCRAKHSLVAR